MLFILPPLWIYQIQSLCPIFLGIQGLPLQAVVLMPGCVGISASAAGTNKPQTILLMPVSSVPAFTKGGFPVGCSQGAAPDGNSQLIWSGGGLVIPGNAPVGALSGVSQVITSSGQVAPPPLSNISAPKCNQFIVGGGSGNFLLTSNVHPLVGSQTNASNFGMGMPPPPLANLSNQNGGPAPPSISETTPCPARTQPSLLQPSEEISSANDVLLQPKEEPMEEEEKPNSMDNESLWDDYLPRSPVREDEIEETDEKNILPQDYEAVGCGNRQVPGESFSDKLMNLKASAPRDGGCKEGMLSVTSEMSGKEDEMSSQGAGNQKSDEPPFDSALCRAPREEMQRQYLLDSYECSKCFEVYNRPDLLKSHQLTHKDDPQPYKCRVCAKTFNSRKRQVQHIKNHYNVPNRFKRCQENSLCEETQCQLLLDSYECCMCFEVYDRAELLESHKLTHKDDPKPYKCRLCRKTFAGRKGQVLHMKYHYNVPNRYECDVCKVGFSGVNNLKMHVKMHARDKVQRSYKCSVCPEEFPSGHTRDKHEARHSAPRNACTKCDKVYYTKAELQEHMRAHESNRTHKCNVCSKGFSKRTYLKYHMQLHDAVKRHVCKECGLKFAQYSALWQHQKRHQERNRYVCDICGKGFPLNYTLKKHKERHFNGKKRGGRKPKVKCIVVETHDSFLNGPNGETKLSGDQSDVSVVSGDVVVQGLAEGGSTECNSAGGCKGVKDDTDADASCALECNDGLGEKDAPLETNVQSAVHNAALISHDRIQEGVLESSGHAEVNDKQST
ncbi:zinc finger protein 2-like isoform X2 [Ischnura elegans]|uniref:zinc finger protein 2-like isoform X2 n=1 Tax=Ischnura elegans TaxID=197161 RepID=UPI001ED8A525|nr:zinc finger protein 2-like isoform X2 [Ischnura elegans]